MFQFQNGAIIRQVSKPLSDIQYVSIPKWCDYKLQYLLKVPIQNSFNSKMVRL